MNTLKKDWQSSLGIGHVLQVVRCLLINPFPESALNEEAGKDFMEDYDEYCKKAKMYTEVHARASSKKADGSSAEDILEVSAPHRALRLIGPPARKATPCRSRRGCRCRVVSLTLWSRASRGPWQGEPLEKKQKPVDSKAAEKRRIEKKKSLKRL